jgi:hypothetical protein
MSGLYCVTYFLKTVGGNRVFGMQKCPFKSAHWVRACPEC